MTVCPVSVQLEVERALLEGEHKTEMEQLTVCPCVCPADVRVSVQLMTVCPSVRVSVQLEVERALLEGEHKTEMEQLQEEQENINQLKQHQHDTLERATRQREKVGSQAVKPHLPSQAALPSDDLPSPLTICPPL